jgi:hypothetical protein
VFTVAPSYHRLGGSDKQATEAKLKAGLAEQKEQNKNKIYLKFYFVL